MKQVYNTISSEFNVTRQTLWPELLEFKKYLKDGQKILDLGCGNGRLISLLKEFQIEYVGTDISESLLNYAKKQDFGKITKYEFIEDDMLNLDFKENDFDIIFIIASFHHLKLRKDRIKMLIKIEKWLKKDGIIIMTNWNLFQKKYLKHIFNLKKKSWNDFSIPWKNKDRHIIVNRFYHGFTLKELEKLLEKTEFNIIKNSYSDLRKNIITIASKT